MKTRKKLLINSYPFKWNSSRSTNAGKINRNVMLFCMNLIKNIIKFKYSLINKCSTKYKVKKKDLCAQPFKTNVSALELN